MRISLLAVLTLIIGFGCQSPTNHQKETNSKKVIDIQGHRGARGLLPENTIPGFLKALELGVTTLELDLSVTKDKQLVVSHEPFMSHSICSDSSGNAVTRNLELKHNIYQMTYDQVKSFDCGSRGNERFPDQQKIAASKPLLSDVIDAAENHIKENNLKPVYYNIELKTTEKSDKLYHPGPEEFSDLVYNFINERLPWDRVIIQCFDFRVLQYFNSSYPDVTLAQLIENDKSWEKNVSDLGFEPEIYSCYFELLTKDAIAGLQKRNIKVIPWTINEVEDMKRLVDWGVDGIITDYPDRAINNLN